MFIFQTSYLDETQLFGKKSYGGTSTLQDIITNVNNSGAGGLVWTKRTDSQGDNVLYDTVRGAGNFIVANTTNVEVSAPTSLTAFNGNGFSVGTEGKSNLSGADFVAFNWLEEAGYMDIVEYTGTGTVRTQAHNLGVVPAMIFFKKTSDAEDWPVYHKSLNGGTTPEDYVMRLNTTAAESVDNSYMAGTAPTSSVFSLGTNFETNASGATHIAYLFAEKAGFSKAGQFQFDGNKITLGFEPGLFLYRDRAGGNWVMLYRDGGTTYQLLANWTNARSVNSVFTYSSDGITPDNIPTSSNNIYFAWK